jgi:hypothetical protein
LHFVSKADTLEVRDHQPNQVGFAVRRFSDGCMMTTEATSKARRKSSGTLIRILMCLFIALAVVPFAGCDSGTEVPPPTDTNMLRGIIRVYSIASRDLGRPPKSIDELKAVYAAADPDPGRFFRSTRDGQEFVIVWGLNLNNSPGDMVVAHERTGVDGKRLVVTAGSEIKEVSEEEFDKLRFPKDHKPASEAPG